MAVHYYEQDIKSGLKDKRRLSTFLKQLILRYREAIKKTDISFIFCSDAYLLTINKDFLQHDTFTDIITFDLSETENELQSEIYISIERVRENAEKFEVSYEKELHRVLFHGILHLCGFKDKISGDKQQMREKEEECLAAYFSGK